MRRLWKDFDGEPFLINPHLISVLNPKKGAKKIMARRKRRTPPRNAAGRFVKRSRAASKPRRARRRSNVFAMNPPRRARRRSYARRSPARTVRRYRRNPPSFLGGGLFGVPFTDFLYAGAGFVAVPGLESIINNSLPVSFTSTPAGKYAVKAGLALGLGFAASKLISREAGKAVVIGGGLYVIANAVVDFMPQIFGGFSGYLPGRMRGQMGPGPVAVRGMQGQRMLGRYTRGAVGGAMSQSAVPERLSLAARF
ncbi:hypothetical protein M0R72_17415 [Candidatus Pacearchaeota archaeon]|jgi:hypothetical protein|nr:hypothetical protein [Candidatus Pacearchaeota archaeon]